MRLFENTGKKLTEAFDSKKTTDLQNKAEDLKQKIAAKTKELAKSDKELNDMKAELKKLAKELMSSKADDSVARMKKMQQDQSRKANQ